MGRAAHLCAAVERKSEGGREGGRETVGERMKYRKRGKRSEIGRNERRDDKGKSNLPKATQQHQEFITTSRLLKL